MLRVQTEAFQAANAALGQMRAAALPAPSDMTGVPAGVGVGASIPSTPEALTAGRDATPPHLQVGRGLARVCLHIAFTMLRHSHAPHCRCTLVVHSALGSCRCTRALRLALQRHVHLKPLSCVTAMRCTSRGVCTHHASAHPHAHGLAAG